MKDFEITFFGNIKIVVFVTLFHKILLITIPPEPKCSRLVIRTFFPKQLKRTGFFLGFLPVKRTENEQKLLEMLGFCVLNF